MDKIFQRLIDGDLVEPNGLTIEARISVSEELANEIISLTVKGNAQVEYCRVRIHPKNRISLDVKTSLWPWPLKIGLKLFSSVDITHSSTIRAFLENHVLLGRLGSLLNMLPDGIHFYEDQIALDIGAFVNSPEPRMLLSLIKTAEIRTEEGRLLLDVEIRK